MRGTHAILSLGIGFALALFVIAVDRASHATAPELPVQATAVDVPSGAPMDEHYGPFLPQLAEVAEAEAQTPKHHAEAAPPTPEPTRRTISGTLAAGDILVSELNAQGVDRLTVHYIARDLRPIFDFRDARPGDRFTLVLDEAGRTQDFRYYAPNMVSYHLYRDGETMVAEKEEPEQVQRTARIAGVVTSSLYEAIRDLGETPRLASDFADLFAWDIDFSRSVQRGDQFAILYERLFRRSPDGTEVYAGPGRILAARYEGRSGTRTAAYYEGPDGIGGYYRADGSSVERQFLVAPLRYTRISSAYSEARKHPILKITRAHHGIDYAAPRGTPLYSVADGTISFRGYTKGYGRLVKIKHANGYESYYAHMERYEPGQSVGDHVKQKQVIGYVGSSGLATGPHTCFRVKKDGRFVNPAKLRTPAGDPVPDAEMARFRAARAALFAQLDQRPVVATNEAL